MNVLYLKIVSKKKSNKFLYEVSVFSFLSIFVIFIFSAHLTEEKGGNIVKFFIYRLVDRRAFVFLRRFAQVTLWFSIARQKPTKKPQQVQNIKPKIK